MESNPLVSFVTPFFNTREYLAECIESVLRQTYQNWEYILIDNHSTDGSNEIAKSYASRFPEKIRLIRTESFLTQVQNYNFALTCISPNSKYCKFLQADDWLFPDCVRSMVEVAEAHPSVGIVGAYELEGEHVNLDGLPYPTSEVSGSQVCRLFFLEFRYLFGTPTSTLLRSELIRSRAPFYEERYAPFEDGHVCLICCGRGTSALCIRSSHIHDAITYPSSRRCESLGLNCSCVCRCSLRTGETTYPLRNMIAA